MNQINFWKFALDSIEQNIQSVLMVVAESIDSSPGKQGFKMLIRSDGQSEGTIGGGIMEKEMIEFALQMMRQNKITAVKRLKHAHSTKYEQSGLICGGFQTILFKSLNHSDLKLVSGIIDNLIKRKDGLFTFAAGKFSYKKNDNSKNDFSFYYNSDDDFSYQEKIGFPDTAYIIGGGHVGLAVSQIMNFLGFYVITFDHRSDVFTMGKNIYAHEKIITDYKNVGKKIKDGYKSYVIIVTPAHFGDKAALASVLGKKLKYLGMMGSKRKIKKIFNELKAEGFSSDLIDTVHSPIGLEIYAETPNEIAISIAAEITKIKNQ